MNKKFFAALASATMAFTASGSIAVFADDFVEEKTPIVDGDLKPKPTKVVWNEENFGALVDNKVIFGGGFTEAGKINETINASELEAITSITLPENFKGEVKGLEYFTGITAFDATNTNVEILNDTLDFAENTKLATLNLKKGSVNKLTDITLPKPEVNEKKEETYHLDTLVLDGTKLTSLDLSAQKALDDVYVRNNVNLTEVIVRKVLKSDSASFTNFDLSGNALETVNLDNYTVSNLNLSNNHIGALDLRETTLVDDQTTLGDQTFYVSENVASVNLTELFPALNVNKVTPTGTAEFDGKTGVLKLAETGNTTYSYDTGYKVSSDTATKKLNVMLKVANPMNRLYNPNSGEHFYTADIKEKEALVALGWKDEGFGWVAPKEGTGSKVYRLYNPNAGDHHYTMDDKEVKTLVAYGWKDEGTGWYSADSATEIATQFGAGNFTNVPVYRQYNPYANGAGAHNYTTNKAENDYLVSLGWTPEGIAWTALQ